LEEKLYLPQKEERDELNIKWLNSKNELEKIKSNIIETER